MLVYRLLRIIEKYWNKYLERKDYVRFLVFVGIAIVLVITFLVLFLRTRLGLAIRATGNNPGMVRSSSINPYFTTIVGLCVANALTGL